MKKTAFIVTMFLMVFSIGAVAQTSDVRQQTVAGKYVISAKAGGVNYVEGAVAIVPVKQSGRQLTTRDQVNVGDRVSTGQNSKAELLLNPGSYMRIGANTAIEFVSTDLANVEIKVDRGSAIFEVYANDDFKVRIKTPNSSVYLIDSGVFRIDVAESGKATVAVFEGKAMLGDGNATIVKEGRKASLMGNNSSVSKFDEDKGDALDVWSKSRGKMLAKATAQLKNREMRNALMSSFLGRRWNAYNSFGLWVYDYIFGGYRFLPFGWYWDSPYGYGYGPGIGWYHLPPVVFTPPYVPPVTGGGGSQTPQFGNMPTREPVPPFVQMGGGNWGNGRNPAPNNTNDDFGSRPSAPVYVPSIAPSAATGSRDQTGSRP